ncbi:phosphatase PAP2 family protein [Loigolactobacillus coryniformis]|uniref:phosphatase PAP2 family protein n=1 Tax=Loigolactobacillus coryniformis TaxID=1610 RepID=UPI001C5FF41D|nr:phosphatase PAP2 family protein [Loigolactobacillus coryniformis]MBW4803527.1 phosphatase PAP2 family protein [Loigolactobacillus coryniformis subsp. torquens]MBW4806230.1 phosphatase PAP2 family protein [Loigolactobacillus coryniformis subsp. torquens]
MNLRLKKRPPALLVVLIILMILALLAHFQAAPLTFIDQALTTPLQAIVTPTKTFLMRLISVIAKPAMAVLYAVVLSGALWYFQHRAAAIWVLVSFGIGGVTSWLLKFIVARPRPTSHVLLPENGYSFPSGHVFSAVMILSLVYFIFARPLPRLWQRLASLIAIGLWLGLIVASRVYLGAHYPSDTIAALLLGYLWLHIALWLHRHYYAWLQSRLENNLPEMRHANRNK